MTSYVTENFTWPQLHHLIIKVINCFFVVSKSFKLAYIEESGISAVLDGRTKVRVNVVIGDED